MEFYFEITEGPHKGEVYKVTEGSEIGRTRGEVTLSKDPKISSLHARVMKNSQGRLYLVDQDSANGIKYQGRRVRKLLLEPYAEFSLGRSSFKVLLEAKEKKTAPEVKKETWLDIVKKEIQHANPTLGLAPNFGVFEPAVELTFAEGIQAETRMTLIFGPREFGSDTLDVELEENVAPPIAFTIKPAPGGAIFTTEYPRLVTINGGTLREKFLTHGDQIRLGQTLIHVGFKV